MCKEVSTLKDALNTWVGYLGVANEIKAQTAGQSGVSWQVVQAKGRRALPLAAVGVGVSQILPILVMGLLAPTNTLLVVEQPELHLHPSVQARLGDFFNRGLDNNEIVLRSIIRAASDVIADRARGIPGYRLHHFRESEAANSPQLIRNVDQAKAWRLMVSKHGAGWRMHYWQIPTSEGSVIEFANVCKESEREIY